LLDLAGIAEIAQLGPMILALFHAAAQLGQRRGCRLVHLRQRFEILADFRDRLIAILRPRDWAGASGYNRRSTSSRLWPLAAKRRFQRRTMALSFPVELWPISMI
jgi:hypothetical protein